MRRILTLLLVLALLVLPESAGSAPDAAQGDPLQATTDTLAPGEPVTFPRGAISFADAVVDYQPVITADNRSAEGVRDPQQALGPPDYIQGTGTNFQGQTVTLGSGGQLTLEFLDNGLTGDGTTAPDSWIGDGGDEG